MVHLNRGTIILLGGIGALLGGVVAVLSYVNMKEHREFLKANAKLENELKQMDILLKKDELKKSGFSTDI